MKLAIVILTLFALGACSNEPTCTDNNGWQLGDDAGNNASDGANNASTANGTPNNGTPNNVTPNNNTTPPNNNTTVPVNNTTSTNNTNNMTTRPTNNMTMGNGTGVEGDACRVNSDCNALVCCSGMNQMSTCQPQCLGGGLCGGNDAECEAGDVCCDFSGVNRPDNCVAENFCANNMGGTPCMNNNECQDPEVCCLGFDGSGECTTDCFTGGACEVDADCRNNQACCDITVAKVCFDQCMF